MKPVLLTGATFLALAAVGSDAGEVLPIAVDGTTSDEILAASGVSGLNAALCSIRITRTAQRMTAHLYQLLQHAPEYLTSLTSRMNLKCSKSMYRNSAPWLWLLYICAVGCQVTFADLHAPFVKDQYLYFLKTLEIIHGNFTQVLSHSMGWPVFAAPFLALVASATLEQKMLFAHIISAFTFALTVFPAYYLLRQFVESRRLAILGTAFIALNPIFVWFGAAFTSESLFVPLGTLIFALLVRIPRRPWFLVGAMAFAGAAVAVRPNGIFFVPIALSAALWIYGYQYAVEKQSSRWLINRLGVVVLSLTAFAAIAMPTFMQRAQTFGSPFDYGENNKFLVDDWYKTSSDTDAEPSFADYLTHTPPQEIARKFLVNGFARIIANLILSDQEWIYGPFILPVLLPFFIIGVLCLQRNPSAWVLVIGMTIWIALLSVMWDAFGNTRYLWPLIAVTSVFSVAGIECVYNSLSNDCRSIFFTGVTAGTILFLIWTPVLGLAHNVRHPKDHAPPAWALWAAAHLKGRIAIYEGGDFLMQLLPDASIGGATLHNTYAPVSGISVMRPGNLPGPESAWAYFRSREVSYVVVGTGPPEARPYLLEIGNPKYRNYFEPVYADRTASPNVAIFKVAGIQ